MSTSKRLVRALIELAPRLCESRSTVKISDNKGGFMVNVGFVVYTKGKMPGVLNSRRCESALCWGTGIATGGPAEGFVGRYHARYFDENDAEKIIIELVIEKNGEIYTLSWLIDGEVRLTGIGMEVNEGLAAGFRPID